jgi:autotransporter-associated beta strand protein
MKNSKHIISLRILALATLVLAPSALAQTPPIIGTYEFNGSVTYNAPARQPMNAAGYTTTWKVADNVIVTISNAATKSGNGVVFDMEGGADNTSVFTIGPSASTGWVIFLTNTTSGEGGVLYQTRGSIDFTNVSFISNASTKASAHGGGALRIGSTITRATLNNVIFDKNYALSLGGAIRTLHGMTITSGTFTGNYAASAGTANTLGYGGAIAAYAGGLNTANNGVQQSIITKSYFAGNWASRYGGAIGLDTLGYHSFNFFDHTGFDNNFAGAAGGAFYDFANINAGMSGSNRIIDGQRFVFTGLSGATDFTYSGNIARGVALTAAEITAARAGAFDFTATAAAKAGGFYFSDNTNTRVRFDIAEGVTVSIGKAGNPSAWDSFANSDVSGTTAKIELVETMAATGAPPVPGGTLILHADNSYFQGDVSVSKGTLLLGNQNARLGGAVTVGAGATFGGAGELVTYKQNDTIFANRTHLTLAGNARLQVGVDSAETLTIAGDLVAGTGITFDHNLFAGDNASKLIVAGDLTLSAAAPSTINLAHLATGTFTLMEWAGSGITSANLDNLSISVAGIANSTRSDAALSLGDHALIVTVNTINNFTMRWTGAEGAEWSALSTAQRNWADSAGSAETSFFYADRVVFDGVADTANPASRAITLADAALTVSGMTVSGSADYEFLGTGAIVADATVATPGGALAPDGKLLKTGDGELRFANTGANLFKGGIELGGGILAFDRAAQLGASAITALTFTASSTLRASGTVSGVLATALTVASGVGATLEISDDAALAHSGALDIATSATLAKTGDGILRLSGNSATSAGVFAVEKGAVQLAADTAALGGKITVASGATFGGIGAAGTGGSVTIASGGILAPGLDSTASGTLTVNNLALTGGAILRFDLFETAGGAWQKSDRILATGASTITGANTIDLATFATGNFNLGNLTALVAPTTAITLSGMALPTGAGARVTAALSDNGGVLELLVTADQSRVLAYTAGPGASTWNLTGTNWTDNASVNQFGYGDRVLFSADSASRDITIGGDEVRVADMTVAGAGDHAFTGGDIHASAGNVRHNGIADATGKLTKTGAGTLTFANEKNTFLGGVEIDGGVLAISHGDQLTTSATTGINFTGDATFRANADLALGNTITVDTNRAATLDTNGHDVTLRESVDTLDGATFVKAGAGAVLFESPISSTSGTLAVRSGVARAGAQDVFALGADAAIVVETGATLDLGGHDQTVQAQLSGAGTIDVADARFTYDTASGTHTFAGIFTGTGAVEKIGAGKWTLSGSSNIDGDFFVNGGVLGLANNVALGAARLTVSAPAGATLSIEADGLSIPNIIAGGAGVLTLDTNGRAAEFSGGITAPSLSVAGTGTLTLSGNNTITALAINNPLVIARRAESIGNAAVGIADGSTLELRGIQSGAVYGNLTGDRVLVTSSTVSLSGANNLRAFDLAAGSRVTAASIGALGGASASVTVRDGARINVQHLATLAGNMSVDGGTLVFGAEPAGTFGILGTPGSLALSGTLSFSNGGEIRLGAILPTGIYNAAVAYGGISGMPVYDPHQGGMFMVADIIGGDTLRITAYNKALEPGKDIVVAFDALSAMMRSVNAHIGEELVTPLANRKTQSRVNSLWIRAIGSFMEYGGDREHLGYTDSTYAGIIGYDWISTKSLMLGGCLGWSTTSLETTNNATTDMDMPYAGLYAARRMGNFYASADVTAGLGSADTRRREDFRNLVTGSYKLDSFGGSVGVGYLLPLFSSGEIKPSIGIHYMNLSFHDYAETGQGAVRLDNVAASLLQGVVRVDASKHITLLWGLPGMVGLSVGWRQNFINERTDAWATLVEYPGARLQIRGDEYAKNSFLMGFGIRMMLTKTILFSLAYDYDCTPFGDRNNGAGRHTLDAVLRLSW